MRNFSRCHPSVNFIFYLSAVIFGMIFLHPVFLCISFFGSFLYNMYLDGKKTVKTFFFFLLPMLIIVTFINGITNHYGVTELFTLHSGNKVCLEPLVYGFVTGIVAVTVIMWFSCYNKTVSSDKLLYVLGGKMPKTALILTMALRFVPLYSRRLKEINDVQSCFRYDNSLKSKFEQGARSLSVLFSYAMENSIVTADSMKSRGYGLEGKSKYSSYDFCRRDVMIIVLIMICDITVVVGKVNGAAYVLYNPFFKINPIGIFSYIAFAAYFILCFTPLFIDMSEDLKWKILK